jgi:hypothetical protein
MYCTIPAHLCENTFPEFTSHVVVMYILCLGFGGRRAAMALMKHAVWIFIETNACILSACSNLSSTCPALFSTCLCPFSPICLNMAAVHAVGIVACFDLAASTLVCVGFKEAARESFQYCFGWMQARSPFAQRHGRDAATQTHEDDPVEEPLVFLQDIANMQDRLAVWRARRS